MINPRKFALLGTKQKIYKIASTIRNMESSLKQGVQPDTKELLAYTEAIRLQEGKKIHQTIEIISRVSNINSDCDIKEKLKTLNFVYHDLLCLLEKKADEDKNFSFIQFDSPDKEVQRFPWIGILDNLRSPMNVGTIFRSADGFGAESLFLTGITPCPPNPKVSRTALGAEEFVPFQYYETTEEAVHTAKELGYKVIALEVVEPAKHLSDINNFDQCAFIFGNEEFGITESILNICDDIVRLPLVGKKNSLNVGNVFSIVAYTVAQKFLST
ncbi:MAG: TrmH family RNA methyltransferase [Brevinemataceae bacterium]